MNNLKEVIFFGIILIVVHAIVFLFFDLNSYFVFALLTILGYMIYISNSISKNMDREGLENDKIKENLLKKSLENQTRTLMEYKDRLNLLNKKIELIRKKF